jgi:ABC-type sugar transport system ATPase subunit
MAELAKLIAITTSFDGVCALRGVDFEVRSGEVHALIGENGSGKSALMRVLCGQMAPSSGEVRIDGTRVEFRDPRAMSIAIVNQEIALAPDLSVAENIFLGELSHVIAWGALRRRARDLIHALGFDIDPRRQVGSLTVADQQIVKIAKALSRKFKIVVFDEPIAELSTSDADRLHKVIGKLRSEGVGIVYVSDRLEEVLRISDRVTVLKDGEVVGTQDAKALTIDDAIRMMVGRPMSALSGLRSAALARARACAASVSPCAQARSSASAGWSGPAARKWRARSSAPIPGKAGRSMSMAAKSRCVRPRIPSPPAFAWRRSVANCMASSPICRSGSMRQWRTSRGSRIHSDC